MPLLSLRTNISLSDEDCSRLLPLLSNSVAEMLGKPERYVMVEIQPSHALAFAGSADPAAVVELKSIGLPQQQTQRYSATLCDLIEEQLDIPPDRVYVEFTDAPRALWGWNRTTFER